VPLRTRSPLVLLHFALIWTSLLIGIIAARRPSLALALVVAVLGMIVAISDITAAVAGYIVLAVVYLGAAPKVALLAGAVVAVGWLFATAEDPAGRRSLIAHQSWLAVLLVAFFAWMVLGLTWAADTDAGVQTLERYAVNLFLFPAVLAAVRSYRQALIVIGALVAGAAVGTVLAALGAGASPDDAGRLGGPAADPNTFAAILLPAAILGAALCARAGGLGPGWRLAAAGGVLAAMAGVLATGSRGALVAMGLALVAAPLLAGRWRGRAAALTIPLLVLGTLMLVVPSAPLHGTFTERGLDTSGRSLMWTVGWRMVEDHPLGGVGVGGFRSVSADYLLRPGVTKGDKYVLDTPLVAHNSYLQVWAESGTIGLLLFSGIVATSLAAAWRAARRFGRARDVGAEILARAVLIAMLAMLAAVFFISYTDYGRPLWVLLALGPALLALSRERARPPGGISA
jgi:O-antigen ligase